MSKLSKREKIMIYILIVFALIVGGVVLVITPAMDTHSKVQDDLDAVQLEKDTMQLGIASMPQTKVDIEEYKKKIETIKGNFFDKMENEEIDSLVTGLVTGSGMTPVDLEITPMAASQVVPFGTITSTDSNKSEDSTSGSSTDQATDSNATKDTSETSGTDASADSTAKDTSGTDATTDSGTSGDQATDTTAGTDKAASSTADSGIIVKKATITISGTMGEFISLIGAIYKEEGMRIAEFTLGETGRSDGTLSLGTTTTPDTTTADSDFQVQMVLEVYMKDAS